MFDVFIARVWGSKKVAVGFLSRHKYWIFVLVLAYAVADLLVLAVHPYMVSYRSKNWGLSRFSVMEPLAEYIPIWDFNIFHNGPVPPALSSFKHGGIVTQTQPKVSNLPLTLNGTIVYKNPVYSIANITLKNQNKSGSYQIYDEVESLARVTGITSDRVYLINLTNHTKEYIAISNLPDFNLQFRQHGAKRLPGRRTVADKVNQNVDRSFINKHLRSLPEILQQASVVPHWEDGKMIGYRFKYIQPGSPYEKLGFRESDIIKTVEGEQVRSELQAAELFHRLKHKSRLSMTLERDGEDLPFSWTVNEDAAMEDASTTSFH